MALGIVLAPYGKIPGAFPSGILYSYGSGGHYSGPDDPRFNTRGEVGWYTDTQMGAPKPLTWGQRIRRRLKGMGGLGNLPTDFELSRQRGYRDYQYTPTSSGWIATGQGYLAPPWLPPSGYPPGGYEMPVQPLDNGGLGRFWGLRDDPAATSAAAALNPSIGPTAPVQAASVEDVIATLQAHQDRVFALTLVSTTAVAVSALITIFRTMKLIRKGNDA